MKLLVTGGAGFIGSHIAEQALGRGWEVAVVDDLSSGRRENVPAGATFFEIDIRDRDAVFQAVEKFQPDVLSHQAAQASVAISVREPVRDAEINVIGTLNLLDASVANGVSRFVFASTGGAIYGEVPSGQATEETAPRPLSPYAASKAETPPGHGLNISQSGGFGSRPGQKRAIHRRSCCPGFWLS